MYWSSSKRRRNSRVLAMGSTYDTLHALLALIAFGFVLVAGVL